MCPESCGIFVTFVLGGRLIIKHSGSFVVLIAAVNLSFWVPEHVNFYVLEESVKKKTQ